MKFSDNPLFSGSGRRIAAAAGCAALACCCAAPARGSQSATTNALVEADASGLSFDAGADFRLRQEMMDNIPGNPGNPYAINTARRGKNTNQFRIRPRVWFEVEGGPFRLYTRIGDEFREYAVKNGKKRKNRGYTFPDEVYLDNLYLEGKGLTAEWLESLGVESFDFRAGRQDMMEVVDGGLHGLYGLDRLLGDGTPLDGSRTIFTDMVRARFNFSDVRRLDAFFLYDNGRNNLRWGNRQSRGRAMNPVNMADDNQMDEWGGGLVYSDAAFDRHMPFEVYTIFKRNEEYHATVLGRDMPAKELTTVGAMVKPRFDDNWGMTLEGAKQFGRILDGNKQAGGHMGYLEVDYRADFLKEYKPIISWCSTYYSGDRRHDSDGHDNDTAWDPLWARHCRESEMLVYGNLYGNCYWSNMLYTYPKFTMTFGRHHGLYAYSGPMFAVVQDRMGHDDGAGHSMYKGWLSAARYDFPIKLAPKNAAGCDRIELFGHVVAEVFNPGDYFSSSKPAYFARWQLDFKF